MQQNNNSVKIILIIILLGSVGTFVSDMYVPSLPAISAAFHTSNKLAQWTITIFFFGLSIAQFFYGSLSDVIGRKKAIVIGLSICVVGSIVCCIADSIWMLLVGRFIQAIGSGTTALFRAILRDSFSGKKLARMGSIGSMAFSIAPAAAPIVGGYVETFYGWRMSFIIIMIIMIFALSVVIAFFKESNKKLNPHGFTFKAIIKNFSILLRHKNFLIYIFCSGTVMAGLIAYIISSPFLFQTILGLTPIQYGWLTIYVLLASIVGKIINAYLLNYMPIKRLISLGFVYMIISGLSILITGLMGYLNVEIIIIPVMIYILAGGFIFSNAMVSAMEDFSHMAGSAAAMYGGLQLSIAFIAGAIISCIHQKNQIPIAYIFLSLGILGYTVFNFATVEKRVLPAE